MGVYSRDVTVKHDGHEIALAVALTEYGSLTVYKYKLYIDGQLTDEDTVSLWDCFRSTVTLRGQLPPCSRQSKPRQVKVVANLRWFGRKDYPFFVDDEQIHQEWAPFLEL